MAIVRLRSTDLKDALETSALSLHYQPQVEIKTGKLAGVEAFVRWPHAVHGMLGPSDIIPIVEQAGLHVEFDRWVIGAICRQAKRWRTDGVPVPVVAANVWSEALRRPDALRLVDAFAANADAIRAVVAEAKRTGGRVVADSVESVQQEEALASLGVEIVQGYLYGPEVTPAELRTLIKRPGASA